MTALSRPAATAAGEREVQVRAGDTLDRLCAEHYGDASLYPEVARRNDLASVRQLEPGTLLVLPHLPATA